MKLYAIKRPDGKLLEGSNGCPVILASDYAAQAAAEIYSRSRRPQKPSNG